MADDTAIEKNNNGNGNGNNNGHRLTVEILIPRIRDAKGNLAAVARAVGVTRQSVCDFVQRHPTCQAVCAEARETMLDNAESVLYNKVLQGDITALIFFLKTQGHRRGYTERLLIDIEHSIRRLAEERGLDPDQAVQEAMSILASTRTLRP